MKRILYSGKIDSHISESLKRNHSRNFNIAGFFAKQAYQSNARYIDERIPFYEIQFRFNYEYTDLAIDKALLKDFYAEVGHDVLLLLDRFLDKEANNSHLMRSVFIYVNLNYIDKILNETSPDAVLFTATPHDALQLMLYWLAKRKGIHTYILYSILEHKYFSFVRDYKAGDEKLKKNYNHILQRSPQEDLSEGLQAHYNKLKGDYKQAIPGYEVANRHRGYSIKFSGITWRKIKDGFRIISKRYQRDKLKRYFLSHVKAPQKEKYIFFGLNYQPERTSMPEADYYANVWLVVKLLADVIPADWKIYIKEHPSFFGRKLINLHFDRFRSMKFYESVLSIPNVSFVQHSDPFYLIDHAIAVATLTGTVGFESLIRGKPVLSFGYSPYRFCEGSFSIGSKEDLVLAVNQLKEGYVVRDVAVKAFLKAIEETCVKGNNRGSSDVTVGYAQVIDLLGSSKFADSENSHYQ